MLMSNDTVLSLVFICIGIAFCIAPVFVYLDATKHNIGKTPNNKLWFNMKAGAWATSVFAIAILAIPLYLLKRNDLIERAKTHPVELSRSQKNKSLTIIVLFSLIFLAINFA